MSETIRQLTRVNDSWDDYSAIYENGNHIYSYDYPDVSEYLCNLSTVNPISITVLTATREWFVEYGGSWPENLSDVVFQEEDEDE